MLPSILLLSLLPQLLASSAFPELLRWLREDCGGHVPEGTSQLNTGTRGVISGSELVEGSPVAIIPRKCLVTNGFAREHPSTFGLFSKSSPPEYRHSFFTSKLLPITLWLLDALDDQDHFFRPYFNTFPKGFANMPVAWDKDALGLLPPRTKLKVEDRRKQWYGFWSEIVEKQPIKVGERWSFDDFLAARFLVGNRNFGMTADGEHQSAMVPLVDLLNHHKEKKNTEWGFDEETDSFRLVTTHAAPPGAHLYDSYGMASQAHLLVDYGFTLPCGWEDESTDASSVHVRNQESIDQCINELELTIGERSIKLTEGSVNPSMDFVKEFKRTMAAVKKKSPDISMTQTVLFLVMIEIGPKASPETVAQSLNNTLNSLLSTYPMTFAEAQNRLKHVAKGSPAYDALQVLVGELSILEAWLHFARVGAATAASRKEL